MTFNRLQRAWDGATRRSQERNQPLARLGKGDADQTLFVSGRTGMVWARLQFPGDSTPFAVRAHRITPAYGAPVVLERARDGVWEVKGSDGTTIEAYSASSGYVADSPAHAVSHQYWGSDPLVLDSRQMPPLRVRPTDTPSLSVYVEPVFYTDDDGNDAGWDGGSIDLTSKVPSSTGQQRLIIVGLDKATGTLTTADGTATFVASDNLFYNPFTRADVVAITLPGNFEPSGVVRLYTGQTRIDSWDIVFDRRNWFGGTGSSFGLSLQPTVIDSAYTIPADYQAIWARGRTIASGGSITVSGDEYILNA